MSQIAFREAQARDIEAVVAIYNQTVPSRMVTADTEEVTIEQKQAWFDSHTKHRPLIVAEQGGKVLGWLSFKSFYGRPAYEQTVEIGIYLDSAAQGQGLGSAFMTHAEEIAKRCKIRTLLGFIFSHNVPSIKLFAKFAYQTWGELPDIAMMDGKRYGLTIMGKHLHD